MKNNFLIDDIPETISHYKVLAKAGEGGFSRVFQAKDLKHNRLVALKFVSREIFTDTSMLSNFEKELRIFSRLNHPNIAKYYDTIFMDNYIVVVMELLLGGRLSDNIENNMTQLPSSTVIRWTKEVLEALKYLHSKGIVHRDIKPENILFDTQMRAKLVDFGLSTEYTINGCSTACGTPFFFAPEMVTNSRYDPTKSDIWSFGVTMYNLVTKRFPFADMTPAQYISNVHKLDKLMIFSYKGPLADVLKDALKTDPNERKSAAELLSNTVFKKAEILLPKLNCSSLKLTATSGLQKGQFVRMRFAPKAFAVRSIVSSRTQIPLSIFS